MFKKVGLLIILLLFLIPVALSQSTLTYPNVGGVGQDFQAEGVGGFTTIDNEFDTNVFGVGLNDALGTPIFDDLDNDTLTELIIIDEDIVKLFRIGTNTINTNSTLDYGDIPTDISNILSFDIDGDGQKEIIFGATDLTTTVNDILIINYSISSGLQIQNKISLDQVGIMRKPMIGCRAVNECLITVSSTSQVDPFDPHTLDYFVMPFDSTNRTSTLHSVFTSSGASSQTIAVCSPRDKNIKVSQRIDGEGIFEYIISMAETKSSSTNVNYRVIWLDNVTVQQIGLETNSVPDRLVQCTGADGLTNMFTSPLVAEIHSSPKKEAYIGASSDQSDFQILGFRGSDGSKFVEYPNIFEADGEIISNVMLGDFFPESGTVDICVMGLDTQFPVGGGTTTSLNLLCGSESLTGFNAEEFAFDVSDDFNLTLDETKQTNLAHGEPFDNDPEEGEQIDEIINAYGVFHIDFTLINELERIFDNPAGESVSFGIDPNNVGADSIISMASNQLLYIDNLLVNTPAQLKNVTFDPCIINTPLKINTTLQVKVEAFDTNPSVLENFDDVNINVTIYQGSPDQIERENVNLTNAGIGFPAIVFESFILNVTGTNRRILIEAWDNANPETIDTFESTFTVGLAGAEFGDSSCSFGLVDVDPQVLGEGDLNLTADAINNQAGATFLETASNVFSLSPLVVWILLMLGAGIGIMLAFFEFGKEGMDRNVIMTAFIVVLVLIEVLLLIVGVILGAIPFGILLTILIISGIAIGLWLRQQFTASRVM